MTDFLKMHGLGNDFIILDWRDGGPATVSEAAARAPCNHTNSFSR